MVETQKDTMKIILRWVAVASVALFGATVYLFTIYGNSKIFSDFAETISYCISRNPYTGVDGIHSIYPPFAFLPFYLFALICKGPLETYLAGKLSLKALSATPSFIVSFILFYLICISLILFIVWKITKFKGEKLVTLFVSIVFSAPFLFCFLRGNNIISVALLALLFFWLYDSEKRWQREIANLCLAATIAMKIFPAFLLLFFIKDRRWLDLLKTLGYALVLIFIPFLLIEGGFANIKEIWNNFTHFNSGEGRNENWTNISFDSLSSKFSDLVGVITGLETAGLYSILSKITRFGSVIMTIVVFILCKKSKLNMQAMAATVITYELFQGVSYAYTITLLLFPFLLYVMNFDSLSKTNRIYYGTCFACMTLQLCVNFYNFIIPSIALAAMLVKCYIDLIKDFKAQRKAKKEAVGDEQKIETVEA